jgi:hypothetical protein
MNPLQVRPESPFGFIAGVADAVSDCFGFITNFAMTCHVSP